MGQWDYFVQEVRNLKIEGEDGVPQERPIFYATIKGTEAAHRSLSIIMASADIHKYILMQTASTLVIRWKIFLLYNKKKYITVEEFDAIIG